MQFFRMSDGEAYRDDLHVKDVCGGGDEIIEIELLITTRRVAVKIKTFQRMKIFVWDLEFGHRYLVS